MKTDRNPTPRPPPFPLSPPLPSQFSLGVEKVATYDTAGSAKMISEGKMQGCGAIASDLAAEAWGMDVIASNIEDDTVNFTRFLLLGRQVRGFFFLV